MKTANVIPFLLISLTSYPLAVKAKLTETMSKPINSVGIYLVQKPKFPDNGAPTGRRRGGTSRDGCPTLSKPVTALVPGEETLGKAEGTTLSKSTSKSFLTSTVAEYPSFLFYIPALPTSIDAGEFVLQDEAEDDVYRTPLTLPQKPGIIGINLIQNVQYSLQINKKYHWYFKVYCEDRKRASDYFFVDGWIQRVALMPRLNSQLSKANLSKYKIYTGNNLWYDALTNLADLRYTNSHNAALAKDWDDLLKPVGLQDLTGIPIIQRYNQLPTKM